MNKSKKQGTPSKATSSGKTLKSAQKYKFYTCGKAAARLSDLDGKASVPVPPEKEKQKIIRTVAAAPAADAPEVEAKELKHKLHVVGVKMHIEENVEAHNTKEYDCTKERIPFYAKKDDPAAKKLKPGLVVRRGQEFKLTIDFDRPYSIKENDIMLLFNLGHDTDPHNRLTISMRIDETGKDTSYKPKKWGATVVGQQGNSLTVSVFVPATACIGEWSFSIRTTVGVYDDNTKIIWEYKHINDFVIILFNPWCKEDLVYMEEDDREEYVENESGVVFCGSYRSIGPKVWLFGQFEDGILDACLRLVMRGFGGHPTRKMASPSAVSRVVSQMVNAPDNGGVLIGNWSGDYSGGAKPTSWAGSVKILRQYMTTGEPVPYGQCWVFSGITTTVCRALGIPCRSVTNHSSAHNTDEKLTIDILTMKGADGKWQEEKIDSVWNFHVWNECWFRTPNLNTDKFCFDGWQVIDATPQELSGGVFCCGPAPVVAVKEGEIDVGWDTPFVFAEVNGDKVWWRWDPVACRLFELKRDRKCIGRKISTHKRTGKPYQGKFGRGGWYRDSDMEREELVSIYKYPEGSEKEKEVHRKAEKKFRQMRDIDDEDSDHECDKEEPVVITIEAMKEDVLVGAPFGFNIKVQNTGSEDRVMTLDLEVLYKTYFDTCPGIAAEKTIKDVNLKKGASQTFTIEVDVMASINRPGHGLNFLVTAKAEFQGSDHVVMEEMDYRLRRPDIEVQGPSTCSLFDTIAFEVSFTNPLTVPLTECIVDIEGLFDFVEGSCDFLFLDDIGPGKKWTTTLKARPQIRKAPERVLCVGLESKELGDISGSCCVEIKN